MCELFFYKTFLYIISDVDVWIVYVIGLVVGVSYTQTAVLRCV